MSKKKAVERDIGVINELETMKEEDLLLYLRTQALSMHQHTIGRGDKLIEILERAVKQIEKSHARMVAMNIILFSVGVLLLFVGIYQLLFGNPGEGVWGAILGGTGGVASLAATFWTAPIDKISKSVSDLIKLEAAFLGYIRVIGEVDSAFQMQYLDILAEKTPLTLGEVTHNSTQQIKEIMEHTLILIEKYVTQSGHHKISSSIT